MSTSVKLSLSTLVRCIMLLATAELGHDPQIEIGAKLLDTLLCLFSGPELILNSASASAQGLMNRERGNQGLYNAEVFRIARERGKQGLLNAEVFRIETMDER